MVPLGKGNRNMDDINECMTQEKRVSKNYLTIERAW